MSTYVIKYIEVKEKAEWKPLLWYSKSFDKHYPKDEDKEKEVLCHYQSFVENLSGFRQYLNDSDFSERGLPSDCSQPIRKDIESVKHKWGTSYYTLNELSITIEKEETQMLKYMHKAIDMKILYRLNNIELLLTDNSKKLKASDGESCFLEELSLEDLYSESMEIINQLKYIYNVVRYLVNEIVGYINDDKIRIIFYIE